MEGPVVTTSGDLPLIDYHLHVIAHGDRPMTVENIMRYCEVAKERGLRQMGITEHDRYLDDIDVAAFQEARELSRDVELRLGIEIDFDPGEEVDRYPDADIYAEWDTYELYEAYYENVRKAALSGRFDVLGHPDLIKIF